ncbi:MAG: GNAT family N-acetyltransferase [Micropepsaceae bacterium]
MVSVRLAKLDDAESIAQLTAEVHRLHNKAHPELFRPPHEDLFSKKKLAALLKDSNNVVGVAQAEGEIVGHVYAELIHRAENVFRHAESTIYVHQIGVREDSRRQGIGSALMNFIEEHAAALGVNAIGLDHWAFNTSARDFFEARGFTPSQVKMRKELKG